MSSICGTLAVDVRRDGGAAGLWFPAHGARGLAGAAPRVFDEAWRIKSGAGAAVGEIALQRAAGFKFNHARRQPFRQPS